MNGSILLLNLKDHSNNRIDIDLSGVGLGWVGFVTNQNPNNDWNSINNS